MGQLDKSQGIGLSAIRHSMSDRGGAVEDFLDASVQKKLEREEHSFRCASLDRCRVLLITADLDFAAFAINRIEGSCFWRQQFEVVFLFGQNLS